VSAGAAGVFLVAAIKKFYINQIGVQIQDLGDFMLSCVIACVFSLDEFWVRVHNNGHVEGLYEVAGCLAQIVSISS
jgi:hypothetical protein